MMVDTKNPFSQEVTDAALQHAKEVFPQEAAGLVLSGKYVPCSNIADDPESDFQIPKEEVAKAQKSGKLEGVWHSHTKGQNAPSLLDMKSQIAMDVPWGIHVLETGEPEPNFVSTLTLGDHLLDVPYEGRPWVSGVFDCVNIVRSYFKQELGVLLPNFPRDRGWWDEGKSEIMENTLPLYKKFFDVLPPEVVIQKNDVVVMAIRSSYPNHFGVMIEDEIVLHHMVDALPTRRPFVTLQATMTHVLRLKP